MNVQTLVSRKSGVDDHYLAIVKTVLDMQRLIRLPCAKVSAPGNQVVVIQVPVKRGPRVVEHPLNDSGRAILVSAIGLKHGPLAVISHELCFQGVVGEAGWRPVSSRHGGAEVTVL